MTSDLHLAGPTVTLFGDHDSLDAALSTELGRRGCSTHTVTTPTGWLTSASHAIVRLDSQAGRRAIEDLAACHSPAAHVVVVRETSTDEATTTRFDDLCRTSSEHHDVSVISHAPMPAQTADPADESSSLPAELAATVADEIGHQAAWTSAPSFSSTDFEPHRHRGRATP